MKQKAGIWESLAVCVIAFMALYIRLLPFDKIFTEEGIRFATNDAWYHMRTVDVLLTNFPHNLFYNPLTNYPIGSYIHFGILYDMMIAVVSLVLGFGNPSQTLVDTVGAYFPAVLGALVVIPVYFIGKQIGGKSSGFIAAILIAFAPGQYLSRSMLGFTDHHIAEVLFSTLFMLCLMKTIKTADESMLNFSDIKEKQFGKMKNTILWALAAGFMYAAYQLCWAGAPLFALLVAIFLGIQHVVDIFDKKSSDYLAFATLPAFVIALVTIIPFIHIDQGFSTVYYSLFHIVVPVGVILGTIGLNLLAKFTAARGLKPYYYPGMIIAAIIGSLLVLYIVSRDLYATVIYAPTAIFGVQSSGGASTIQEVASIFYDNGVFTLGTVCGNFTVFGFLLSVIGLLTLGIKLFQKSSSDKTLLLVWGLVMFGAIYGQNRFAYYYSVNVVLLCGYIGSILLNKVKFGEIFAETKINNIKDAVTFINKIRLEHWFVLLIIGLAMIYPTVSTGIAYAKLAGADPVEPWYDSCVWLRDNTPDPGMNFNATYEAPVKGELYDYPETAYGVMSWWDYGHYIEAIGYRMPNANPFQAGIGGRRGNINETNVPGAATFFTAQSEEEATAILEAIDPREDKSGARYIMSDAKMATDIFLAMPEWTLDTEGYTKPYWTGMGYQYLPAERYYNSMEARLHIFDGNGLEQYRLVHESEIYSTNELAYKQIYNFVFSTTDPRGTIVEDNTGYVKLFEYVKGAKITGNVQPGKEIVLYLNVLTNQGRLFNYTQTTTCDKNGNYSFTVPYASSTLKDGAGVPMKGETQFDTRAITPYYICYDVYEIPVYVEEKNILDGSIVAANTSGII